MTVASGAAEWLTAVGTVLAVVVVLGTYFAVWLRERRRRPSLTVAYDPNHSELEHSPEFGYGTPFIRLRVGNARGTFAARDVQLLVEECVRLRHGEPAYPIYLGNPPPAWTNAIGDQTRMTIPPGADRYVDLGYIKFDDTRMSFELAVEPQPFQGRHRLDASNPKHVRPACAPHAPQTGGRWRTNTDRRSRPSRRDEGAETPAKRPLRFS